MKTGTCDVVDALTVSDNHFHFALSIRVGKTLRLLFCKKSLNISENNLTLSATLISSLFIMKGVLFRIMRIISIFLGLRAMIMLYFYNSPFQCHVFFPFDWVQDINIMTFNLCFVFTDDHLCVENFKRWHFFISGRSCLYMNFLRNFRLFLLIFMKCMLIGFAETRADNFRLLFGDVIASFYSLF